MTDGTNQRPLIVKRKKQVAGGGHHGGAWKVAYADFVTAMMAFFMLMWLLNATTEQQRKGIADYFSPNIPITRISGGGDGSFGGDDVFSETTAAQNGTGATSLRPTEGRQAMGLSGTDHRVPREESRLEALADAIARGADDEVLREIARHHVQMRLSDEGLVIEIFARPEAPLFVSGTLTPSPWLDALAGTMAALFATVENAVAISGHVPAEPVVVAAGSRWSRSLAEAEAMRLTLTQSGLPSSRVARVTGHADRSPALPDDPMSVRNSRIEVILLRAFP
jgi:chemotaxis protein MotB